MRTRFLMIALLASTFMHANYVPGYLGKRLSVGYNASSFFFFDQFIPVSEALFNTRFSYKSEFAVNYTVARKISIGASVYYGSQRYLVGDQQFRTRNNYYQVTLAEEYMRCKLLIYEFNMKFFRRNFIAPIGPYHQLGIGLVKYNAKAPGDSLNLMLSQNQNIRAATVRINDDPYSCVKLSYHIGYAAPVFKNCYFNMAIGVNFFRGGDSARIRNEVNASSYIPSILNRHLRRHNFLEVKIGFGWLAL